MINEAFMFFWAISVVGKVEVIFTIGGVAGIVLVPFFAGACGDKYFFNKPELVKPLLVKGMPLAVLALILGSLIPPKEAFYAGAVQYVGEATEIDQTMLRLKDLLDQKISDLEDEQG